MDRSIPPGMGDGRGPGVCGGRGGGGEHRGSEERRVRQGWRQQRGQKKKMNSGELGSTGEAAEVSVEVSECYVSFPPFAPSHNQSENTDARGGQNQI